MSFLSEQRASHERLSLTVVCVSFFLHGWDVNSGRRSRFESNLIKTRTSGNQGLSPRMEESEIFIKSLITNNSDLRRIPDVRENFQSAIFSQVKDDTTIKHSEFDTG